MRSAMYPRFVERRVASALSDTRVVLITGPRQSGKTTLARRLARDGMEFLSLDNATTLAAARADPVGLVRGLDRGIIDEAQRAPELLLAIKESVDADTRPGRFLLTGSASLMSLPQVADSLAGRLETIALLPLSQSEIRSARTDFLEQAFRGELPAIGPIAVADDLEAAVLAGGYPEALGRGSWSRRQSWYLNYVAALVQRDVRDVARIERVRQMPRLLRALAQHAGQLVNYSAIGAPLGMNHTTTQRYTSVFEQLYLIQPLQPWYTNVLKRLTRTSKLHFLDSGLLASLRDLSPDRLKADRAAFGPLLESFVFAELLKLASWSDRRFEFFHFRNKERNEVDIVIEDQSGRIVGIEVKAAATATTHDFAGLRKLADASGGRFALGLLLYDHNKIVPFGDRLFAAPISTLWGVSALARPIA